MSKKAWIIFAAVVVALLGGLVYISSKNRMDVSDVNVQKVQSPTEMAGNIGDQVFGKKDSKVVLVEYGDYQCPGCGQAYPNLKAVSEKYEDQLAFVFRNFPLTTIHPNARAAAAAAEAAGLQGKYWEMHDSLYENQSAWKDLDAAQRTDTFTGYAKALGLNTDRFKEDLSSQNINRKISFDLEVGKKDHVNSTPTILINGKQLGNEVWNNEDKLDEAVAKVLKENGIKLPDDKKDK